jgi:hypothetical protein
MKESGESEEWSGGVSAASRGSLLSSQGYRLPATFVVSWLFKSRTKVLRVCYFDPFALAYDPTDC